MGSRPIKIDKKNAEERVFELRSAINRQRQHLTTELDELRRRRIRMMDQVSKASQFGGTALVGTLLFASLIRAVFQLLKGEKQPEQALIEVNKSMVTHERIGGFANFFTSRFKSKPKKIA